MSKRSKSKGTAETDKSILKKLGEGGFGCVVSRPMKCSGAEQMITSKKHTDRKEVGKLFYEKRHFDEEVRLAKLVKKIDPSEEKMLVATSGCAVAKNVMENPKNVKAVSKCETISKRDELSMSDEYSKETIIPNKIWQLKMPYSGVELDIALEKYKQGITVKALMSMITPLLEALILLKRHKLVHQDIKKYNVLVYKKKAVLIDYSLMIPFEDVYTMKNYGHLKHRYRPFPPEFYLTSLVMKYGDDMNKKEMKQYVLDKYKEHIIKLAPYFHPYYTQDEVIAITDQLTMLPLIIKNPKNMKEYVDKIDIYSVGTTLAHVTQYIKPSTMSTEFIQFMRGILYPDPHQRTSPEDALEMCKKLSN